MFLIFTFHFQYDRENFDRGDKEILSPKRLDPDRFSEFTKSSYIPEPAKEVLSWQLPQDRTTNSSQQYNGIEKFDRQKDIKIVESSNYIPEERRKNKQAKNLSYDPLEPLRKNRNFHDRV